MEINKVRVKSVLLPVGVVAVLLLGVVIGLRVSEFNIQQHFLMMQRWNKINSVLNLANKEYVDEVDTKELEEKTISFVLRTLDPHSVYIPASQMQSANEQLDGNFEGIGITFSMLLDTVLVENTIPGGPSQREGIWTGDRIVTVNDSVVSGIKISQDSVVKLLRGKKGTKVKVGVNRVGEKELLSFTITRGKIPIKSVDVAYMLTPQTGIIKLSKFSRTTHEEIRDAAKRLQEEGMKNLLLDLRDNSGGYLDQAFDVANEFLENGSLIVYTEGKSRPRQNMTANSRGILKETPVAILIGEGSASASEIVAGAIQDNDRGFIIGRRSFGKALVQEPISFDDGSGVRLTVARYYTPTGRCIQRPYSEGEEDYYNEFQRRYEHGEFSELDSIKQNEELKYQTPKGRVVYGGGGITPDIFVPIDTVGLNNYYQTVSRKNLIYKFALQFADSHRTRLQNIQTREQLRRFIGYRNFVPAFEKYAAHAGVSASGNELRACAPLLNAHIKAFIGRGTPLDEAGFYPFWDVEDRTIQIAIQTLEQK